MSLARLPSAAESATFRLSAPTGHEFDKSFLAVCRQHAAGSRIEFERDPVKAVRDADILYTDVWTSMGQEAEREERRRDFAGFQVNVDLLNLAPAHTRFMHCLPAHRGEEVTSDVIDGERSIVFEQAGNRMHAQKALLQWLLT